ncbi:MAG: helix-turn-helix transcriptional regulator [Bacteroidales bacterium]|nr:helix-turn-helix transcriptional regulator [Bacteroidales bacterium]MBQ2482113.1 helix-turn-helix transcriptional regulator [Bacteroidales bacterium]
MVSSTSHLADVVNANPGILSVLERLNIRLGFHEATIEDICKRYGLSENLVLSVFNIYNNSAYQPQADSLSKEDMSRLIAYLQTSHEYYSRKSFPALHDKIHRLLKEGDQNNAKIINRFYDDYSDEMRHHFIFEENIVFPFLKDLLEKEEERAAPFDLQLFSENHTNIEEKLSDLKNTILKYLPDSYSPSLRTEILKDIYSIEEDLKKHTAIEDKLLLPAICSLVHKNSSEKGGTNNPESEAEHASSLSEREKDIVAEVAKGLTNKEIADKLNLSIHTVTTHRKNISRKTGINSISGITVYAIINKLVDLNDLK